MTKDERMMEMYVAPVALMTNDQRTAFRTQVRIYSHELGILMPETYIHIADKTSQSKKIFSWTTEEAIGAAKRYLSKGIRYEFISLYGPQRLFEDKEAINNFLSEIEKSEIPHEKFALEIYPDILLEKESVAFQNASVLRDKGVRIILLNYACENFPLSKISFMPADIVCPDKYVINCLSGSISEREYARSVINLAKNTGKQILVENIDTKEIYNAVQGLADYGSGKLAGNYIKYRYVKVKMN